MVIGLFRYVEGTDDGQPASISLQLQPSGITSWTSSRRKRDQASHETVECYLDIYQTLNSSYPFTAPSGLVIRCDKWPCYVRLQIMQAVGRHAAQLACDSGGMVFVTSLVDWLEENIPVLLQAPPTLASLAYLRKARDK